MQESQQIPSQSGENFNPQIGDIEKAQKNLSELKTKLKNMDSVDSEGTISRKIEELERMYEEIKMQMKLTIDDSEQALVEMRRGFISAWESLKIAFEQAKERVGSTRKH